MLHKVLLLHPTTEAQQGFQLDFVRDENPVNVFCSWLYRLWASFSLESLWAQWFPTVFRNRGITNGTGSSFILIHIRTSVSSRSDFFSEYVRIMSTLSFETEQLDVL